MREDTAHQLYLSGVEVGVAPPPGQLDPSPALLTRHARAADFVAKLRVLGQQPVSEAQIRSVLNSREALISYLISDAEGRRRCSCRSKNDRYVSRI